MDETINYRRHRGVARITFTRPERHNAMNAAMEAGYLELLDRAESDPDVRAIVVTGAGPSYCSGGDLSRIDELRRGGVADLLHGPRYLRALQLTTPVVAAVNGPCIGIGALQALACDVRFASRTATFAFPFARRGLVAEEAVSWLLPRIVGAGRAMDLLLSGRTIPAEEALRIGLVSEVVDDVVARATAYADGLAADCSPTSMAVIKSQVHRHAAVDLSTALAESRTSTRAALAGDDLSEGLASLRERRPAAFGPLDDRHVSEGDILGGPRP